MPAKCGASATAVHYDSCVAHYVNALRIMTALRSCSTCCTGTTQHNVNICVAITQHEGGLSVSHPRYTVCPYSVALEQRKCCVHATSPCCARTTPHCGRNTTLRCSDKCCTKATLQRSLLHDILRHIVTSHCDAQRHIWENIMVRMAYLGRVIRWHGSCIYLLDMLLMIKPILASDAFIKAALVTKEYGETMDCSVKAWALALSALTGEPVPDTYVTAHTAMRVVAGRTLGSSAWPEKAATALSCSHTYIAQTTPATTGNIAGRFPDGVYFLYTRRHVACMVGGIVYDWTAGRRHRVIRIAKIAIKTQVRYNPILGAITMPWTLIWPERRTLSDRDVISWAADLIADDETETLTPADLHNNPALAVSVIMDSGKGTFGKAGQS